MCTPETMGVLEALGPAFAQCAQNLPALSGAGDTLDRAKDWVSLFEPGSDLATCLAERDPAEGPGQTLASTLVPMQRQQSFPPGLGLREWAWPSLEQRRRLCFVERHPSMTWKSPFPCDSQGVGQCDPHTPLGDPLEVPPLIKRELENWRLPYPRPQPGLALGR